MLVGNDLFAEVCNDTPPPGSTVPEILAEYPLTAGTLVDISEQEDQGVSLTLVDAVIEIDGELVEFDSIELRNRGWGVILG